MKNNHCAKNDHCVKDDHCVKNGHCVKNEHCIRNDHSVKMAKKKEASFCTVNRRLWDLRCKQGHTTGLPMPN